MATVSLFLETNPFKLKKSYPLYSPFRHVPTNNCLSKPAKFNGIGIFKLQVGSAKFNSVKCLMAAKSGLIKSEQHCSDALGIKEMNANPFEVVGSTVMAALKALRKPAIALVLLGVLLMYDPNIAMAASGGRMGGKSFSSRSSSSYSSRSYSVPQRSNPSFSYSAPYYAPPFGFNGGGGFYVGPAVGIGFGAGSSLFLILMGFAAFVLVSGFLSDRSDDSVLTATEKTSVLKLQVF